MKKNKYYYVKLYQVKSWVGYIKEGTCIKEVSESRDGILDVTSEYFTLVDKIIVEKIRPFHVREIITGIVFPIVNIEKRYSHVHPIYHVRKQMYDAHTFILSIEDRIICKDTITQIELEKYYHKNYQNPEFQEKIKATNATGELYKQKEKEREKTKIKKRSK